MTYLVAIDPGKKAGVARFGDEDLVEALLVSPDKLPGAPQADKLVIERPTIYPGSRIRPSSIITLSIDVGRLVQWVAAKNPNIEVEYVQPRRWKGQRPKNVDCRYTLSLLNPAEERIVNDSRCPPSQLHNVIDAIGIGLWALGRR